MFTKFALIYKLATVFSLISCVLSSPLRRSSDAATSYARRDISLNNFGGISSLDRFDDFFGIGNFDGRRNNEIFVQERLVCRRQDIKVIQQQLVVLQELAKRVILEQLCEVEAQVIVLSQVRNRFRNFGHDLRRLNGRKPGFDAQIARQAIHLLNSDDSLNIFDLGFLGSDVGKSTIFVEGSNWDDVSSPEKVLRAEEAAKNATSTK